MSVEKIIAAWKKKQFKPVYWFQGEEEYFIDKLIDYAEHHILPESEASFNLSVFYGKDAEWSQIINAARRYPMFAEKQVVILKEAQQMKDLEQLESYIAAPSQTTIFVVGHKIKALDKRTKLSKTVAANAEMETFAKVKEDKIQEWIKNFAAERNMQITPKAVSMIEEHIGNDLSRIENEIEKLRVNVEDGKPVTEDDIEKYIGISKEYNVFELLAAITRKDLAAALRILNYFESNPKLVPIQMAIPALYSHFSKVYVAMAMSSKSDEALRPVFSFNSSALKQGKDTMKNYGFEGVERLILLMQQYNMKGVGVGDFGTPGNALLKELVTKMIMN